MRIFALIVNPVAWEGNVEYGFGISATALVRDMDNGETGRQIIYCDVPLDIDDKDGQYREIIENNLILRIDQLFGPQGANPWGWVLEKKNIRWWT